MRESAYKEEEEEEEERRRRSLTSVARLFSFSKSLRVMVSP